MRSTEMITDQDFIEGNAGWRRACHFLCSKILTFTRHAIKRSLAENPDNHFLPSIGAFTFLKLPKAVEIRNWGWSICLYALIRACAKEMSFRRTMTDDRQLYSGK